jgi:hypothetical protein
VVRVNPGAQKAQQINTSNACIPSHTANNPPKRGVMPLHEDYNQATRVSLYHAVCASALNLPAAIARRQLWAFSTILVQSLKYKQVLAGLHDQASQRSADT